MNKFLSIFKDFPDDFVFSSDYEWSYKEQIGEGGFGKIYKVRNKDTNSFVAIKQLDMKLFDEEFKLQALKSEIEVMKTIKNPNIVQLIDEHIGKNYSYIILELCDSDLKKQLAQSKGKLPEQKCAEIFHQLANGFKKMIKKQYMHRDIKPDNILIKGNTYKIADFGFSKKINMKKNQEIEEVCGTPLYMAPQLLFNKKYTEKCDIWSLGLMLYEMIFGYDPWPTKHPEVYKSNLLTKPIAFPYDANIRSNTYDLLKRCLQIQESDRISWEQFFKHPFVQKQQLGTKISFPKIQPKFQRVLISVQQCVRRKNVNLLQNFKAYSKNMAVNRQLSKQQFFDFLKQMDSTITTYQSEQLFLLSDANKSQSVSLEQFYSLFCEVDYRPQNDIASRRIQEVISLAQAKNIQLKQFFEMFDADNSSTIDAKQFENLIRKIAPRFTRYQVEQMWIRFDIDQSGYIDADEFIAQMTRNAPNQGSKLGGGDSYQRAKRNIVNLGQFLDGKKISAKQFFSKTDSNKDNKVSIQEFGPMIQKINFSISKEQIIQMFKVFDINNSSYIEIQQVEQRFKYVIKEGIRC